ncbi:MAG: domain S-box [Acidobacteria bacterium]|nr:domain S-box [Acidobacteriota bacterium]
METNKKSAFLRYGAAVLLAAAALLLRAALTPLLGDHVPFSTFYPAIVVSAMFGGLRAGLLTTVLSAVAADFFFIPPVGTFSLGLGEFIQITLFVLMGALISWVISERERAQTRLRQVETESEKQKRVKEKALRKIENRSRMAQKFTGVGIWELDLETNSVEWSEGIYQLLGLKPYSEKPDFQIWVDNILEEDRDNSMMNVRKLISAGQDEFSVEFRIIRVDNGEMRWIAAQGQVVREENKKAVRVFGVNYDITERKETELKIKNLNLELNRRVKELQTIFDIAPVGIAVAQDPDCDVIKANPALAEILGVDPDDNISINPSNAEKISYKHFKDGRELKGSELAMQRAVAEKRTILGEETDILRADGKLVTIYCYAAPVFDEEGNVVSCIAAHIDITERKTAERERQRRLDVEQSLRMQAEEANRLKDEFLATVSHELRTPLNSIIGWITMLRDGRMPEGTRQKAIEAIERNAKSQSQLIEDLLDVSRIISGKLQLKVKPIELEIVISAAVETVRPAAEAKNIALDAVFSAPNRFVSGDYDRLQQVVWNLLSNAIKFTPPGGRVEIDLRNIEEQIEISVSDTGKGINPDFLPFVFDRFRQADGSITRNYTGLGLGLAIVRHLVELHGGTVGVESAGEGKGSTFSVKLPLLSAQTAGKREGEESKVEAIENPASDYPSLENVRILIVDDEHDTREILRMAFENSGAKVETAASAFEAFQKFRNSPPRIIISDIGMPEEDGYSFMERVRVWESESRNGEQPIIAVALTAYARAEDRGKALKAGFQKHVAKPVEPFEMVKMVAELVTEEASE